MENSEDENDGSERPKALTLEQIGTAQWPASACCFVIDLHLTGKATKGREPRVLSLASAHVGADGSVLSTFHEYVKVEVSADAAFVSNVHGKSFLALQAEAQGSFKEVYSHG